MMDEIFFSDISHSPKEDNKPTCSDLLADDGYIAQFLNVSDLDLNDSQQFSEQLILQQLQPEPLQVKSKTEQEPIQGVKGNKKRSTFHNFQKHLVTTIRSIVDSSKFGKDPETCLCQKKIWKIFMNSNKINKTLVTMIVGDLTQQNSSKISQYGFREIFRQFQPAIIKQSQININQQVIKQLHQAHLMEELTNRRMKNKKQFVVYFSAFMEELVNGELEKRMTKCTKLLKDQKF